MAEGTYEYECMRAELLGVEKPDYDDFLKKQEENEKNSVDEEYNEIEALEFAERQDEDIKNISGGLGELNGILAVTQRKINRFRTSCSSLTNLLKIKIGGNNHVSGDQASSNGSPEVASPEAATTGNGVTENGDQSQSQNGILRENGSPRKSDLTKALDNHVDSLDMMLEKAENAQYSMQHQTKQMKRFLN